MAGSNPFNIFTARKRSCGKVMFLKVSVILFTWGRLVFQHALQVSRPTPRGKLRGLGGDLQAHTREVSRPTPGGYPSIHWGRPPQQMATAAGGTHPTGMHSLSQWSSLRGKNYSVVIYLTILPLYSRWLTINNTWTINVLIYNWPLFYTLKSLELDHSLSTVMSWSWLTFVYYYPQRHDTLRFYLFTAFRPSVMNWNVARIATTDIFGLPDI